MDQKLGTSKFTDFDGWVKEYSSISCNQQSSNGISTISDQYLELVRDAIDPNKEYRNQYSRPKFYNLIMDVANNQFSVQSWSSYPASERPEAKWPIQQQKIIKRFQDFHFFSETYGQPLNVGFWQEKGFAFLYMGNSGRGIIVLNPEKYLSFEPVKDYSHISVGEIKAIKAASNATENGLLPAEISEQLTTADIGVDLNQATQQLEDLTKQEKEVRHYETQELADMKAKIAAMEQDLRDKQQLLLAELHSKQEEMEAVKEKLELQIYMLDSEIYSIQCFLGETVKFGQIRKGKNASDKEPIVLHQKLRFLDEDLGRMCSLYEIDWADLNMFEDFLQHNPEAFDTFTPNERCVALVRLSRNATSFGRSSQLPFRNMLESYDYYHGKTVGILIRNGENLYLGWTDETRVHIEDDLILSPGQVTTSPVEEEPIFTFESDRKKYLKEQKEMRRQMIDGVISRSFIYNILQGIVENKAGMLPLPKGVTLGRQSEYVQYAVADLWLRDTRFGSMNEIVEHCNAKVNTGDYILTVQSLVPERDYNGYAYMSDAWRNTRGRGEANRTRDCSVEDCHIYPINLVEFDEPVSMTNFKHNDEMRSVRTDQCKNLIEGCELLDSYEIADRHMFVSVRKQYSKSNVARANFEVYEREIINLTYMNSIWLEWVINNKSLGGWSIGGKTVDYAYAIRYLKTAIDFVRKRELAEKQIFDLVNPAITQVPEWQLKLSEWKYATGVRTINDYQARRFAKYLDLKS